MYVFQVPTINQETAVADVEPTVTLMKFRSDNVLRPTKKQQGRVRILSHHDGFVKYIYLLAWLFQVYFGQNIVCKDILSNSGVKGMFIRVGDPVFVEEMLSSPAEAPA